MRLCSAPSIGNLSVEPQPAATAKKKPLKSKPQQAWRSISRVSRMHPFVGVPEIFGKYPLSIKIRTNRMKRSAIRHQTRLLHHEILTIVRLDARPIPVDPLSAAVTRLMLSSSIKGVQLYIGCTQVQGRVLNPSLQDLLIQRIQSDRNFRFQRRRRVSAPCVNRRIQVAVDTAFGQAINTVKIRWTGVRDRVNVRIMHDDDWRRNRLAVRLVLERYAYIHRRTSGTSGFVKGRPRFDVFKPWHELNRIESEPPMYRLLTTRLT